MGVVLFWTQFSSHDFSQLTQSSLNNLKLTLGPYARKETAANTTSGTAATTTLVRFILGITVAISGRSPPIL
jgi:hypothetical protein